MRLEPRGGGEVIGEECRDGDVKGGDVVRSNSDREESSDEALEQGDEGRVDGADGAADDA